MVRLLVGVAWPYSNGPQHIGHLMGNALPADIFARYQRLRGREVLMVSGSDMHGTPTTLRAEEEGVTPQVIAERYHEVHRACFERLGVAFDLYTHTHTPTHFATAQGIFLTLLQEGYLEKRTAPAPFCPKQERFLPDRYLTGTCPHCGHPSARGNECDSCGRALEAEELREPKCRLCGSPAVFRPSEHFYLLLPKFTERLGAYHAKVSGRWRPSVRSFTESYLAAGLRPRPITRDIDWGVPVPLDGYPGKRLYVWFEAVIGYLSAAKEWAARQGEPEAWRRFWDAGQDARVYQFLGKDNITFHTVFWPAILLGVGGLQLPYDVPANEWVVLRGARISKSSTGRSSSVWLPDLLERYPPDAIRFYGAYHMPENHDTEYSEEEFVQDHDQVLADQWGNLVHRCLTFVRDRYGGTLPAPSVGSVPFEATRGRIAAAVESCGAHLERVQLKAALDRALELVREGNQYFHEARPWAREGAERDAAVHDAVWMVRALAVLLAPFLPFSSEKVARMLGTPDLLRPQVGRDAWQEALLPPAPGTRLGPLSPLFPKLAETARAGATAAVVAGPAVAPPMEHPTPPPGSGAGGSATGASPAPAPGRASGPATTPPAPELAIIIGAIREVEAHPKADKLYVLTVDAGEERPRTLVAGLREVYTPDDLKGKSVAILANLEPRKLRGIVSDGMVLAAEAGPTVAVLRAPDGTPPGASVGGRATGARRIPYEEFARARLVVATFTAPAAGGTATWDVGEGARPWTASGSPPASFVVRLDGGDPDGPEPLLLPSGAFLVPDRPLPAGAKVR